MKSFPIKLYSLLAISVLAFGCSKEDPEPEPTNEEELAGSWTLIDLDASGTINVFGQNVPFVTTDAAIDPGSYFNFTLNPQEVDYDASATVTLNAGQEFEIPYAQAGQGTWYLKERDSLIVTEQGRTTRYGILAWSDTRLILRSNQNVNFSGQQINAQVEAILER